MKTWYASIKLLVVFGLAVTPTAWAEYADLVAKNGKLWTVDDDKPNAEALAVRDGRFIYVDRLTCKTKTD